MWWEILCRIRFHDSLIYRVPHPPEDPIRSVPSLDHDAVQIFDPYPAEIPLNVQTMSRILEDQQVLRFSLVKRSKKYQIRDDTLPIHVDHILRLFRAYEAAMASTTIRAAWRQTGFEYANRNMTSYLAAESSFVPKPLGTLSHAGISVLTRVLKFADHLYWPVFGFFAIAASDTCSSRLRSSAGDNA
jgi:hypothetical protein